MNKVYLDGYNFILRNQILSRIFKGQPHLAREKLKSLLQEYAIRKKITIIVVYDSREKLPGEGSVSSGYRYKEVFVKDADSYLRKVMERPRSTHGITIVSSDVSDVVLPAKARGVNVISSEEFTRKLRKMGRRERKDYEKPSPPSGEELEDWIRYFEGEST
ncbi:MAG: NYN domain-containing protein [Candidatus Glassbacteria bacterium]